MTTMTARIPKIDWNQGFERHWNGGNPAATHAFNALSFLFPQAERFFVQIAREVIASLDTTDNPELADAVQGFIAQESTHSHQHSQYNAILEAQGFENVVHDYVEKFQERSRRDFSPLTNLAIVCGYEHYTAILGNYVLSNPGVLKTAVPEMALIWGWHSAEEVEHKAVCFDLYRAAGGSSLKRILVYVFITLNFSYMFGRLYSSMLYRDGCLKPSRLLKTSWQSLKFFYGRTGVMWHMLFHGFRYLSPWFHPWNQDNRNKLNNWLSTHATRLRNTADKDR